MNPPTLAEWKAKYKHALGGIALEGTVCDEQGTRGQLARTIRVMEIPRMVDTLLAEMYSFLISQPRLEAESKLKAAAPPPPPQGRR